MRCAGRRPQEDRLDLALSRIVAELDEDHVGLLAQALQMGEHVRQHPGAQQQIERGTASGDQEGREVNVVRLADARPEGWNDIVEAKTPGRLGRIRKERNGGIFRPCEKIARAFLVLEIDQHWPLEQRPVALSEEAHRGGAIAVRLLEAAFRPQPVFEGRVVARRPHEAVLDAGQPELPILETVLPVVVEADPRPENVDRDHRTGVADIVRDAVQKPRVAIAVMGAPAHRKRVDIGIDPAAAAGAGCR